MYLMYNTSEEYKLSVRLMTYMHETFIKEAMDGIMMQKTDFKIEVVVGDDFSTDRTLDIIKSYQNTDQIHIKILDRQNGDAYWQKRQKLGRLYNFINIIENCTGKYVALLDGDDYWTDPFKLQKQVDFLEQNPTFSMCGAVAQCLKMGDTEKEFDNAFLSNRKEILQTEDFLSGYPVHTATVLFRTSMIKLPDWMLNVSNGDLVLFSLLAEKGPVGFINEKMSVYRITGYGVWSSMSLVKRYYAFQNTSNYLNKHFKKKYQYNLRRWEFKEAKKVSQLYQDEGKYKNYLKFILKNYHRYFWRLIWLPQQNYILKSLKLKLSNAFVKFGMYIGLRTRIKNIITKLNKIKD